MTYNVFSGTLNPTQSIDGLCCLQTSDVCELGELRIVEDGDELTTRTSHFASAAATSNGGIAASQRPASSSALLDTSCINNHSTSSAPMYSSVDSIVTSEFSTRP